MSGPYAASAREYWRNGWTNPLPIGTEPGRKKSPPSGYTGEDGRVVSWPDLETWCESLGHVNVGQRLKRGQLGLDVDDYAGKSGGTTLKRAVAELGPLPATVVSTSRGVISDEQLSGIRFYKVPVGRTFRGAQTKLKNRFGEHLDVVHHGHRYAVVWPSVHPEGGTYQWWTTDGQAVEGVPSAAELPELPGVWVEFLADGPSDQPQDYSVPRDVRQADTLADPNGFTLPGQLRLFTRAEALAFVTPKMVELRQAAHGDINRALRDAALQLAHFRAVWPDWSDRTLTQWLLDAQRHAWVTTNGRADDRDYDDALSTIRRGLAAPTDWRATPKAEAAPGPAAAPMPEGGEPQAAPPKAPWEDGYVPPQTVGRQLKVTRASEITQRATRWLWDDDGKWLPLGGLSLLGGREGIGKSSCAYWLAGQVTRGELPGALKGAPRSVVIAATEDAWAQTVVPRLVAAGADLERVLRVDVQEEDGRLHGLILPTDVVALAELCRVEDVALVLLDPLMGTIEGKLDSHKDAEVRQALEPISRLAHDLRLSVLGLIHQNKSAAGDLLTRLMGSRAFAAIARSVLVAAKLEDPEHDENGLPNGFDIPSADTEWYVLGQAKSNLGPKVRYCLRYSIESARTGHDDELDEDVWSSRVVISGRVTEGVQDLVTRQETAKPKTENQRGRAEQWLREHLTGKGAVLSYEVKQAADEAGHTASTLDRASKHGQEQGWLTKAGGGPYMTWSLTTELTK